MKKFAFFSLALVAIVAFVMGKRMTLPKQTEAVTSSAVSQRTESSPSGQANLEVGGTKESQAVTPSSVASAQGSKGTAASTKRATRTS